jgi:hypothetical protein
MFLIVEKREYEALPLSNLLSAFFLVFVCRQAYGSDEDPKALVYLHRVRCGM